MQLKQQYPNLSRITQNVMWLGTDNSIRLGIGLCVTALLARYFGPEQFGIFNYAIAFAAFFYPLVSLGLETVVVRELVRNALIRDKILGTVFIIKLAGGLLAFLFCFLSANFFIVHDHLVKWLILIVSTGIVFQSFDVIDLYYQSQVLSRYTILAKNSSFLIMAGLKVYLISRHAPLELFAAAVMLEIVLGAINMYFIFRHQKLGLHMRLFSFPLAKDLLKQSSFMIMSAFMVLLYIRMDQVLVGRILGERGLGMYAATTRITEMFFVLPVVLTNTLFPLIVQYRASNKALYELKL
ncbi:MAG: flippase, partial [Candidatus Omnitrophota bacterium]